MRIIKEIDKILEMVDSIEERELKNQITNSLIQLQEHFDVKVRCVICNKELIKPDTGQLICGGESCKEEYYKFKQEEWKSLNENK